jgi:hypothetical protein
MTASYEEAAQLNTMKWLVKFPALSNPTDPTDPTNSTIRHTLLTFGPADTRLHLRT